MDFLLLYTHTGHQPISSHTITDTSNSFIMVDSTNNLTSIKPNVTTTTGTVTTKYQFLSNFEVENFLNLSMRTV